MAVIDASVFVSLFNATESSHSLCVTWFESAEAEQLPLNAPVICLAEVAGPLVRQTSSRHLAEAALKELLNEELFTLHEIDRALAEEAAQMAIRLKLRGYDSLYVALAIRLKEPLVTLDQEVRTRAKQAINVVVPGFR